jgi:hypothetical protein
MDELELAAALATAHPDMARMILVCCAAYLLECGAEPLDLHSLITHAATNGSA